MKRNILFFIFGVLLSSLFQVFYAVYVPTLEGDIAASQLSVYLRKVESLSSAQDALRFINENPLSKSVKWGEPQPPKITQDYVILTVRKQLLPNVYSYIEGVVVLPNEE